MSNLEVVRQGYAAFQNGDIEAVLSLCDPAIEWTHYGAVPWAGRFQGPQDVQRFFGTLADAIEFEAFEPQEFVDGGENIAVFGRSIAKARGTAERMEDHWAQLITVRSGKIVRFVGYDTTPFEPSPG